MPLLVFMQHIKLSTQLTKKTHQSRVNKILSGQWRDLGCSIGLKEKITLCLLVLSFGLAQMQFAYADDLYIVKQRFEAYKQRARELQTRPEAKYFTGDFSDLNQWIGQATRDLNEEEEENFERMVNLLEAQLKFMEISMEENQLKIIIFIEFIKNRVSIDMVSHYI